MIKQKQKEKQNFSLDSITLEFEKFNTVKQKFRKKYSTYLILGYVLEFCNC